MYMAQAETLSTAAVSDTRNQTASLTENTLLSLALFTSNRNQGAKSEKRIDVYFYCTDASQCWLRGIYHNVTLVDASSVSRAYFV